MSRTEPLNEAVVFIGHFSSSSNSKNYGVSFAGIKVQYKIIEAISMIFSKDATHAISMQALSFKGGPLYVREVIESDVFFPPIINIPLAKNILFSSYLFCYLWKLKPSKIIIYNSYFFENLTIKLYKFLSRTTADIVYLIQDVVVYRNARIFTKRWFRSLLEILSLKFISSSSQVIAITQDILNDFRSGGYAKDIVFSGAPTINRKFSFPDYKHMFGMFAGSIEPHNGIELLLESWITQSIPYDIYIFGKGSLLQQIMDKYTSPRIHFMGEVQPSEIIEWSARSYWNFCLRYDGELNQKYFFPSKFFDLCLCPGYLVVNKFLNIPSCLTNELLFVENSLCNLSEALNFSAQRLPNPNRRIQLASGYSWESIISTLK